MSLELLKRKGEKEVCFRRFRMEPLVINWVELGCLPKRLPVPKCRSGGKHLIFECMKFSRIKKYDYMLSNNPMLSDNIIIRRDKIILSDNMLSDNIVLSDKVLSYFFP
jgi:hypothetical protein